MSARAGGNVRERTAHAPPFSAYETSKLYRDLKLRGAIVKEKQLLLLPNEEVYSRTEGVWNLSSDQGNLGTFFITNVRLVWFANLAENFNVSIPYMQMVGVGGGGGGSSSVRVHRRARARAHTHTHTQRTVRLRDSRFGLALVVETTARSGGYILGFRVEPEERLRKVAEEVSSLHSVFSVNPIFGVEFDVEEKVSARTHARTHARTRARTHARTRSRSCQPKEPEDVKVPYREDDVEIVDDVDAVDTFAAYYADADKDADREPVFSEELGLAVEGMREGYTIKKLWEVVSK